MSHDKIKAAARARMASTGEPYATARRQVIAEIRAAAGAHHELGPEYSDAVVASFLERVDQEIAARVDERLAARAPRARPVEPGHRRAVMKGFAAGVASSVAVVLLVAGTTPEHHKLLLLLALAVICGAGAYWA